MDYLRARFDEEFGLDELAEAVGAADRFQLSRGFRREYGTSPHACLVQLRLAEARRLLREKWRQQKQPRSVDLPTRAIWGAGSAAPMA